MKVTVKTVSDRITILENLKTISIGEEFQLACLRGLLAYMTAPAVKLPKPYGMQDHDKWLKQDEVIAAIREAGGDAQPADAAQSLDEKRVEFIQSLAEDPALLSGKSGLLKYKFDQHWFAVDGCRETGTHYVARLRENGVVTHYAKSLYDFREDGEQ